MVANFHLMKARNRSNDIASINLIKAMILALILALKAMIRQMNLIKAMNRRV